MVRPFYPCNWGKMGAARGKTGYWPFLHEDSVSERVNYHVTFVFIIGQISLVILLVRFAGAEKRISGRNNLFYRRTNSSPALVVSYAGLRRPTSYACDKKCWGRVWEEYKNLKWWHKWPVLTVIKSRNTIKKKLLTQCVVYYKLQGES